MFYFPLDILTATANERVHPCACASTNSKDPVPNVYVVFVGVNWRANSRTSGCNKKNVSWLLNLSFTGYKWKSANYKLVPALTFWKIITLNHRYQLYILCMYKTIPLKRSLLVMHYIYISLYWYTDTLIYRQYLHIWNSCEHFHKNEKAEIKFTLKLASDFHVTCFRVKFILIFFHIKFTWKILCEIHVNRVSRELQTRQFWVIPSKLF